MRTNIPVGVCLHFLSCHCFSQCEACSSFRVFYFVLQTEPHNLISSDSLHAFQNADVKQRSCWAISAAGWSRRGRSCCEVRPKRRAGPWSKHCQAVIHSASRRSEHSNTFSFFNCCVESKSQRDWQTSLSGLWGAAGETRSSDLWITASAG